jgi:acyl-coenzyme A synthetase/AMP-(fatty) acid ligase
MREEAEEKAKEEYHGIAAVSLDGGQEKMIDLYSKRRRGYQLLWAASNLTTGVNHTVKIRCTGNKNTKALASNISIDAAVVRPDGEACAPGEKGIMVLKRPFPGLTAALWGEPERYGRDYWERIPNVYYTGDSAHIDEDGYVWFAGRSDEIIKIAGHRIGTIEVESAFLMHASVAECGVIGRPDDTRGEVISAFVVLKHGHVSSPELKIALLGTVRREMGPVAVVGELNS